MSVAGGKEVFVKTVPAYISAACLAVAVSLSIGATPYILEI